jgi:hypothetical protein
MQGDVRILRVRGNELNIQESNLFLFHRLTRQNACVLESKVRVLAYRGVCALVDVISV